MTKYITILLFWTSGILLHAQISVNAESPKGTLHLIPVATDGSTAEGMMAPDLTRTQLIGKAAQYGQDQKGAFVYVNTIDGTSIFQTTLVDHPGYYYFDGSIWQPFHKIYGAFFYMPPFNLDVSSTGVKTKDLYAEYKRQFLKSGNTRFVTSGGILTISTILSNTAFAYTVTAYNTGIITVNDISTTGIMTYTVKTTNVPQGSFMNVVLNVKY